jgi:uncharacterized protein (TIGR02996 family)
LTGLKAITREGEADVTNAEEQGFLDALNESPRDRASRLAFADWLEGHDRPYEAMLQRIQAGVSEGRFKVRRRSDGLFSEGGEKDVEWSQKGKEWKQLAHLRAHLTALTHKPLYGGNTPWEDVEIAVFEVRVQPVCALAFSRQPGPWRRAVVVHEPLGGEAKEAGTR